MGFPHSDINGSKLARQLPVAYRSHATSFIALWSQGIHHTLLDFLLGNLNVIYLRHFAYREVQQTNPQQSFRNERFLWVSYFFIH